MTIARVLPAIGKGRKRGGKGDVTLFPLGKGDVTLFPLNKRPIERPLAEVEALGYAGFALIGGVLASIARFDPEAHQRAPARPADYV